MDELIVRLAPFHDENCCFLGSVSNKLEHGFQRFFLSYLFARHSMEQLELGAPEEGPSARRTLDNIPPQSEPPAPFTSPWANSKFGSRCSPVHLFLFVRWAVKVLTFSCCSAPARDKTIPRRQIVG
ncbi:hypothetical protein AV530_000830 [Patagioenas fasciata monilis]|uniref:Uncharacterized protein n=1 Tax=Patagioenas fasciata monilis TaxID=372326 RepID=A0A1V4KSD2_PATFA|nr:hypothetical protein AV530_000830 [Patagioenas fasciata monilis]